MAKRKTIKQLEAQVTGLNNDLIRATKVNLDLSLQNKRNHDQYDDWRMEKLRELDVALKESNRLRTECKAKDKAGIEVNLEMLKLEDQATLRREATILAFGAEGLGTILGMEDHRAQERIARRRRNSSKLINEIFDGEE